MHIPAAFVVALCLSSGDLATITIPTVPIGNSGNAADLNGFGAVAYAYNIGTTEVTNAQYAAFLNAVAATDTNGLFNASMSVAPFGGIARSGASGSYTYSTIAGRENHPVNYVSFWDATRFANWLHNGQPSGAQSNATTEDGAYTLTLGGISANTITRNAGWEWAVTSENEWYKAAYHQPAGEGGDADSYWTYPTSRNTLTAFDANSGGAIGDTTPVGSYDPNFYGTVDMGGNVWEWIEATITGSTRGLRGGSFSNGDNNLRADNRDNSNPSSGLANIGFRVSQALPPSCPGDVTGDGHTNIADFNILAGGFGQAVPPNTSGDLTGDGIVNIADFNILAGDFGCGS